MESKSFSFTTYKTSLLKEAEDHLFRSLRVLYMATCELISKALEKPVNEHRCHNYKAKPNTSKSLPYSPFLVDTLFRNYFSLSSSGVYDTNTGLFEINIHEDDQEKAQQFIDDVLAENASYLAFLDRIKHIIPSDVSREVTGVEFDPAIINMDIKKCQEMLSCFAPNSTIENKNDKQWILYLSELDLHHLHEIINACKN